MSLLLVVAMMLYVFAMTASANEAEPASVTVNSMCPNCGYSGFVVRYYTYRYAGPIIVTGCPEYPNTYHDHIMYREYGIYICDSCLYNLAESTANYYTVCDYQGA